MGGEVEIKIEGSCDDVENTVFVAVSRNLKEGKSVLSWALKSFPGKKICLLHVHQPTHLLSMSDGKMLNRKLKQLASKVFQELERQKMHKLLNQYLQFLGEKQIEGGKIWAEMSNIQKGIVKIIEQHGVRFLVLGAAKEKYYSKKLAELKSVKAVFVCQHAPVSCVIWFVCKGCLIYSNPRSFNSGLNTASIVARTESNTGGKTLLHKFAQDRYEEANNLQVLEHPTGPVEEVNGGPVEKVNGALGASTLITVKMGENFPSYSQKKIEEHLPHSRSILLLDNEFQGGETGNAHHRLEQAAIDAENSKQKAFEESVRRWRAEEDAMEAVRKAKASEDLCMEEANRRKELEKHLLTQRQEIEKMKNQRDQCLQELQMIKDQRPLLESRLTESCCTEKDLEDKIIRAVKLLITFKEKKEELQRECDTASAEARKLIQFPEENCSAEFLMFSFFDIVEATHNFDPSWKIHEGKSGIIYRGNLRYAKFAIKMLPSCNSQSDQEFRYQVEVLSRLRHPHLVTLIGTCSESRSLIYEYLENGSLEDHLGCQAKSPLPWQSRIRIAIEICSALVFLHAGDICLFHGNLKPSKILLDANYVSKLCDLGTRLFVSHREHPVTNPSDDSIYMDPEYIENTDKSDVYSYGILLLRLLSARPASNILRDVKCAIQCGNLSTVLDYSAGSWPLEDATQLAALALRCCEEERLNRPDLVTEVWTVVQPMRDLCTLTSSNSVLASLDSKRQRRIPSYFVCPIFQEVMKDPYIAADGFTYEGDAIKGWLNSGHKTSPMTNLQLDHCELLPNYALFYAIQEWQQQS